MKLLLDENLSYRLVGVLADIYPDSVHVREAGLPGAEDQQIWAYAAAHEFLLASKDTGLLSAKCCLRRSSQGDLAENRQCFNPHHCRLVA